MSTGNFPHADEEKAVEEGDVQALSRYIEKRREIPAPKLPVIDTCTTGRLKPVEPQSHLQIG